jgi:hypothetical protein
MNGLISQFGNVFYIAAFRGVLIRHDTVQAVTQRERLPRLPALLIVVNSTLFSLILQYLGFEQQLPSITNQITERFESVLNR